MTEPALKQDVNLALCGHAWHGKSTLLGKTVAELGMIGRRKLEQFERMAQRGRDPSLVFALMVFRQKDVRHKTDEAGRGITVLPSFVRFDFPTHRVTVIDTPGQEDYTNNRFAGMFSADCAALIVDVVNGVQDVTEQVLRAIKGYEIPLAAVVLTKMDRVKYSQEAYDDAVELCRMALQTYDIPDQIPYIPTSAYESQRPLTELGEGITHLSEKLDWYKGPTLHQFLGKLDLKSLRPETPLRVVIHSADIHGQVPGVGTAFTGLVECGRLKKDQLLIFQPASAEAGEPVQASVRSVELTKGHIATPGIPLEVAHPRQLVGCALRQVSTRKDLREHFRGRGTVAGTTDHPPRVARRFVAEITVFDRKTTMREGMQFTMHAHVDKVAVLVRAIGPASVHNRVDPDDEMGEDEPGTLSPGRWARVTFEALRLVAIEEAGTLAPLSKLVLRLGTKPIALGRCVAILDPPA